METAVLTKRVWVYIINLILYLGIGFLAAIPFLTLLKLHALLYVLIALLIAALISFIFDLIILICSHGYTIGSAILGVRYVGSDGRTLTKRQCFIRSASETILIFVLFDWIYFVKNRTERGVIDRLSDSFAIDIRR